MDLAFHEQRVDDVAAVVDGDILRDRDGTRCRIDVHDGEVRAERVRERRGLIAAGGVEPRLEVHGSGGEGPVIGLRGDLDEAQLSLRMVGDKDVPPVEGDPLGLGVEHHGGDPLRLVLHLGQRRRERAAADRDAAAAHRPVSVLHHVGIAVEDAHAVERDAEVVGHDLGERRRRPLAVR